MSERARRRRPPPPVKVKQAFGSDDEDKDPDRKTHVEVFEENVAALPTPNTDRTQHDTNGDLIYERAFFALQGKTVEVIFDNNVLRWEDVAGEPIGDDVRRRRPSHRNDQNTVGLEDVFGISPIYTHWNWSMNVNENIAGTTISTSNSISAPATPSSVPLSKNSVLRGFQLHSYQPLADNVLQEILIVFQSDDPNLIERWFSFLSKIIARMRQPLNVLVICNPYAGPRQTRHIFNSKVKPMLNTRQCKYVYTEIDNDTSADDALKNFKEDLDSIDSLVIMGGDGSVINVINALIRYVAKENRLRLDTRTDLPPLPVPICIVPNGTTNIISHTIHGNADHCTPILHLFYNRKMKIDMSAVFDVDYKFVTANFGAGAGYPANVLKYFPRYSLHSPRTVIKKSFTKGASKKNLQSIEMEVRYIPAPPTDRQVNRCYRGCPSCIPTETDKSDDQVKAFDDAHIQEITRRRKSLSSNPDQYSRLLSASRRSFNPSNDDEKNWKVLCHHYLQLAVFTNAHLWSFAPQGLSKYGHLADGLLDLVLVESVNRKEFLRYVKRNGNSKNQHELSFTSTFKVKEIEIELKFVGDNNEIRNADNQYDSTPSDNSSDEDMSDNENKPSASERYQPHPPSVPIPDDVRRSRRHHLQMNKQAHESTPPLQSSMSMDASTVRSRNRHSQQQSESETDRPQADQYDSTATRRRNSIFQSLKLKKNKIPLPRPTSARREEQDDERPPGKNRKSTGATLRPARSLLSLFAAGNLPSGKGDKSSTNPSGRLSSAGSGRKMSAMSRSSSMDNPHPSDTNGSSRRQKGRCLWNLDFTPYNSPLIRIKCFCRYLTVYGVGLDPETRIRETNYSCF